MTAVTNLREQRVETSEGERLDAAAEAALWHASRAGDAAAREALIERHLSLARRIAAQLFSRRPDDSADFDDYLHLGMIGLIEAIDRFVPGGEAAFPTFATYRVRGSILNGLEKASERRDQNAFRRRVLDDRIRSLRETGAIETTGREADAFRELVELTIGLAMGAIIEGPIDTVAEPKGEGRGVYEQVVLREVREELVLQIAQLPEREAEIIRAHYRDLVPFVDIAERLGVTKGRVSQLHGRALRRLRDGLRAGRTVDDYF